METKRPAKGIATKIIKCFFTDMFSGNQETRQGDCDSIFLIFLNVFPSWKPRDPPRGLRPDCKQHHFLFFLVSGNQKTRQGDCDAIGMVSLPFILSGNQKTRQGDCDLKGGINLFSYSNLVETKRPAKGIATIQTKANKLEIYEWKPKDPPRGLRLNTNLLNSFLKLFLSGNQKTRQGDCDLIQIF